MISDTNQSLLAASLVSKYVIVAEANDGRLLILDTGHHLNRSWYYGWNFFDGSQTHRLSLTKPQLDGEIRHIQSRDNFFWDVNLDSTAADNVVALRDTVTVYKIEPHLSLAA